MVVRGLGRLRVSLSESVSLSVCLCIPDPRRVSLCAGRERSRTVANGSRTVADGRKRSQPIATDRQWSPTGRSVVLLAVCLFFQKSIYLSIYPRARLRVSLSVSVCLSRTVANGRERSQTVANGGKRSQTIANDAPCSGPSTEVHF